MQILFRNGLSLLVILIGYSFPAASKTIHQSTLLSQSWPINHFMTSNEPVLLNNASNTYSLSFPVSDRVMPVSLHLNLHLYNSNKLKATRSQLVIYINDFYVKQFTLDPINSTQKVKFAIAPEYLVNGYNRLTFKVAQHYTDEQCEDWAAPELWTQIDSVKTILTLHYRTKKVQTSLAQLNTLLNDRLGDYNISFLRAGKAITNEYLYWGAVAAQGVKLRLGYVPMHIEEQWVTPYQWPIETKPVNANFNIDPEILKQDAILLGTRQQLKNLLAPEILAEIKGAYLGLFQQDVKKQNFILVISGLNEQQVSKAVKAFSLMRNQFPDSQQTIIKDINFPPKEDLVPWRTIVSGQNYLFSQLGFITQVMNGSHERVKLNITLPADMYATENAMVTLHLNLAYGAAIRKDSVINVLLNGVFNHAIRLKEIDGAHYEDYQIQIPLRDFNPGLNTLTFDSVLTPSEYGKCTFVQRRNLKVTLYADSKISFPKAGQAASLPDLKLLRTTGYPFVKNGKADNTYIQLLNHSPDTIQTAWHFIARLAEFSQTPLFDIEIGLDEQKENRRNLVIIGNDFNHADMFTDAPVSLGQWNRFSYQYKETYHKPEESWFRWVERVVFKDNILPLESIDKPKNIEINQSGGLGKQFLLMSYPSKNKKDGTVLALLAEKENSLYSGFTTLLFSGLWDQMWGDVFIWDRHKKFYSTREGDTFVVGHDNPKLNLIMHFSRHPWQWTLIIVSLLVLASGVIYKLLVRYKQRVHPHVEEDVE